MKRSGMKDGYIARFFATFTRFVYRIIPLGFLGRLFTSYRASDRYFQRSFAGRMRHRSEYGGGKLHRAVRRNIALSMDKSLILRLFRTLIQSLLQCSLRTVGLFFITAGSYSAIMYWLFSVVWAGGLTDVFSLYAGIGSVVVGIVLLFSDASLGYALFKGMFFGRILVSLFGVSDDAPSDISPSGRQGYVIAVPLGMVMGALAALVSPVRIGLFILAVLLIFLVISIPESGVVILLFALPFVGFLPQRDLWIVLAVALIWLSYVGKLLRGNRTFRMEVQDLPVMILLFILALSGVSVAGESAWRGALFATLLASAYFLAVNLIATTEWLSRCRMTLVTSATLAALVGVAQMIVGVILSDQTVRAMPYLGSFVRAGFTDQTTFAYFLVVALPFALCSLLTAKKQWKFFHGFSCVAILAAIVLTWVQSAWIAAVVVLVVFLLLFEQRAFPFLLGGAVLLPVIGAVMPRVWRNAILETFRADSGAAAVRSASAGNFLIKVFFENEGGIFGRGAGLSRLLFGLGNGGVERFCVLYTSVAPREVVTSMNFGFFALLEWGILGVLVLVAFFFLLYQNCFSLLHEVGDREKTLMPIAGIAMFTGVLVLGIFRYAWYDPAAMMAFFLCAGLVVARMRFERAHIHRTVSEERAGSVFAADLDYYGKALRK